MKIPVFSWARLEPDEGVYDFEWLEPIAICSTCQAKFRLWLRRRYKTVQELNLRWHTAFWGRTVTGFEEVTLPTETNDDYCLNKLEEVL